MNNNGATTWQALDAGQQLQNTLKDERILSGLDHLLQRIDTLENAVNKLTVVMEQGPGMVSMVADMADDTYRKAAADGVDLEQRLHNALSIAEKLTAPAMVEKLNTVLEFTDQAPGLISIGMDAVDDQLRRASANGVDVEERLKNALHVAEKLTAPEMTEKLDQLLILADQAPGLIAMAADSFDEQMKKLNLSTIDVDGLLEIARQASVAVSDAKQMPEAKVGGIFSMLRTMKDPDRQKAIGFVMNIAKAYGKQLK